MPKCRFRPLLICLGAILFLSGCGVFNELSDMHSNIGTLSDNIGTLLNDTGDLRTKASEAYTFQTRHFALEEMLTAQTQTAKLKAAAAYVVAFGFQGWNDEGNDTAQTLTDDLLVAAQEFFLEITEYMALPGDRSSSPTATDQRSMNLYALSAVLQEIGTDQQDWIRASGSRPVTFLSMIEDSLTDNFQNIRTGRKTVGDLPSWENEVLTHYPDIVYLLQVRANFLLGIFLAQVSDIQEQGFLGIPGLINKIALLLFPWTALTPSLNDSSLDAITLYLIGSNESRSYLAAIGESVSMDQDVMKILGNMRIPSEPGASAERAMLLSNLENALDSALGKNSL